MAESREGNDFTALIGPVTVPIEETGTGEYRKYHYDQHGREIGVSESFPVRSRAQDDKDQLAPSLPPT